MAPDFLGTRACFRQRGTPDFSAEAECAHGTAQRPASTVGTPHPTRTPRPCRLAPALRDMRPRAMLFVRTLPGGMMQRRNFMGLAASLVAMIAFTGCATSSAVASGEAMNV